MRSPSEPYPVVSVSATILREVFNSGQLPERIARGELQPRLLRDAHLEQPERVGESYCTRGQMIPYLDEQGTLLVEVFQYLRADGSLGASSLPDPKRMRVGNEIWRVESPGNRA